MRKLLIPVMITLLLFGCTQTKQVDGPVHTQLQQNMQVVSTVPTPDPNKENTPTTPASTENLSPESPTEEILPPITEPEQTHPTEAPPKKPVPSELSPTEAPTIAPEVTVPEVFPTEPIPTVPPATEPEATEPTPTEPVITEPTPTEPETDEIDIAALENYGRSYASSTYGYNGTSACNPNTGAGYFPGATKEILTMEDGYRLVQQAIDSQYRRDMAYGYSPYEEINGVIVQCPINIRIEPTGQPYVYVIWVYYGGDA